MRKLSLVMLAALLCCSIGLTSAYGNSPADPTTTGGDTPPLAPTEIAWMPSAAPVAPDVLGMVVRDPWYDFGTNPAYPEQPNYAAQDRMGKALADMGVRWVRLEFHIHGGDALTTTQIARNDYFINEVAPRHGLKVMGLLGFALVGERMPQDLNITNTMQLDPLYGGGVNDYMRTWLERARMVTARYGGRVAAYEILNEQNRMEPNGWGVDPVIYARLHTKFYRFFRQVDRNGPGEQSWRDAVKIIVGGLHPRGTSLPGKSDYRSDIGYLSEIYRSEPFQGYLRQYNAFPLDGLGYHPYPEEIRLTRRGMLDLVVRRIDEMRLTLAAVGDPERKFWITEIGYNIAFQGQGYIGQGEFMRETYTSLGRRADVAVIFWFKYEDFPPASGPNAQHWGVVRIPFASSTLCPGGACYEASGEPAELRWSYWVYRELAGFPPVQSQRVYMPLVQ